MTTWRKSYPKATTQIKDLPELHSDNFNVIDTAYELEHFGPASANTASGQHRPGVCGVLKEGTTATLATIVPCAGSIAFDQTKGQLQRDSGSAGSSAWADVGVSKWSRVRAYLSTNVSVTSGAAAAILTADAETYDTLSEYSKGVFTPLASGYYLVTAQITMIASAAAQTVSGVCSAVANVGTPGWGTVGSSNNWANIDEYPTAVDTDYNITQTLSATDTVSGSKPSIPSGSAPISVSVHYRLKGEGCVCNNACYGESCTCNNICYGYSCTCHNLCYGYVGCSCNSTCYVYSKSCTCYNTCYGYVACSCNNTTYGYVACSCNYTTYGVVGCTCDTLCYTEFGTHVVPILRVNTTNYGGTEVVPTSAFTNYSYSWDADPSTSIDWTSSSVTAISGFGYEAATASAGCSAEISQAYLQLDWYPPRPVMGVHIYKGGALLESAYRPIMNAGTTTNQAVSITSVVYLSAGQTLDIRYTKTVDNDTIYGNTAYTYLAIHRLAGNCL